MKPRWDARGVWGLTVTGQEIGPFDSLEELHKWQRRAREERDASALAAAETSERTGT